MSKLNVNMHYYFYVDYYNSIENSSLVNHKYLSNVKPKKASSICLCSNVDKIANESFELQVLYPGLLLGMGYEHSKLPKEYFDCKNKMEKEEEKKELKNKNFIESGFSFDYVSGLPYLPGSSLKGVLRSVFINKAYVINTLKGIGFVLDNDNDNDKEYESLELELFENKEVFLDSYPIIKKDSESILAVDYIVHHQDEFGNNNVNTILKVKSGVIFRFNFRLTDGKLISKDKKLKFFKQIILDMGVGARTNVGFGKFQELSK